MPVSEFVQVEIIEEEKPVAPTSSYIETVYSSAAALKPAVRIEPPEKVIQVDPVVQLELDATYNARQCIADHESRTAGMYVAEYGNDPSGRDGSTASGISQWLDSSFRTYLTFTETYYGYSLTSAEEEAAGARLHAAYAPPFVQDLVTAFALLHPDLAQNQRPWPYAECWRMVGTPKLLREDGPEHGPTPYVLSQMG